jgi:hypothetical protein
MSSENEGGLPPSGEPGAEPAGRFDAFRARRAEEREQQETQTAYTFPPEYAADPGTVFPPTGQAEQAAPPFGETYGGPGLGPEYGAAPGGRFGASPRWRSVAIFAGAVVVAGALGLGAWAAFGSSGQSPAGAAAGGTATATAAGTGAGAGAGAGTGVDKHTKALTFRVTIQSVGADAFTGSVVANGEKVTVALTDKTRYGTKAHPFSRGDLTAGETVLVRGRRTGTDTVTATIVAANTDASAVATDDAGGAAA